MRKISPRAAVVLLGCTAFVIVFAAFVAIPETSLAAGDDRGAIPLLGAPGPAPGRERLAPVVPGVAYAGGLVSHTEFVGDVTESFEGFENYVENPDFFEPSPAMIFGGAATVSNEAMIIYEPSAGATFGLGTSGAARVSGGTKGFGINLDNASMRIDFRGPVNSFGAFWGCATGNTLPDPNTVSLSFLDANGGTIANASFIYSRSAQGGDGVLEWHGWSSPVPIDAIVVTGDFVVADGMQANPAEPCDDLRRFMDLQKLRLVQSGFRGWGDHYEEEGYQIDGPSLASFGTLDARYPGSTALFSNLVDGVIVLSRPDGVSFNLSSIDIAPLNAPDPVVVRFTGTKTDGSSVLSSFQHSGGSISLERHDFPPSFVDLTQVTWAQESPFHQFDNLQMSCGVCNLCQCPEDLDGDGVVAFGDIVEILGSWGTLDCRVAACDTPGVCPNFTGCDPNDPSCVCFTTPSGDGFCLSGFASCAGPVCPDGNCPPGFTCLEDTCCGPRFCFPDEFACTGGAARPLPPAGTRTAGGVVGLDIGVDIGVNEPAAHERDSGTDAAARGATLVDAHVVNRRHQSPGPGVVDFEDFALPPGEILTLADDATASSGGFDFTPGPNNASGLNDSHYTNAATFYSHNGTHVAGYHDDVIMTKTGGGLFSLRSFDFAGFPQNMEVPFRVTASSGASVLLTPDGITDGAGGAVDFQTFDLPAAFANISSVTWEHFGEGTIQGLFCLDNIVLDVFDPCAACPCNVDVNRDGTVDFGDILRVLAAWGRCPGVCDDCEDGRVDSCDDDPDCLDCENAFGECVCVQNAPTCAELSRCPDGSCPPGFFCCVNTCCDDPVCLPLCQGDAAPLPDGEAGVLTPKGVRPDLSGRAFR